MLNGVADVAVEMDSVAYLPIEIKHLSGTHEKVELSVQGLPGSVTASIVPQSGTPTYTSVIKFSAGQNAAIGSNAGVGVRAVSVSGVTKEYNLTLNIVPATERKLVIPSQSFLIDKGYKILKAEYTGSSKIYIEYSGSGGATISNATFEKQ